MNEELKSKLTAWALDELPDDERARLEAECESTPEARQYADETRQFSRLLTRVLATPAEAALSDDQRSGLTRSLAESPSAAPARLLPFRVPGVVVSLAAAAAAIVAMVIWWPAGNAGRTTAVALDDEHPSPTNAQPEKSEPRDGLARLSDLPSRSPENFAKQVDEKLGELRLEERARGAIAPEQAERKSEALAAAPAADNMKSENLWSAPDLSGRADRSKLLSEEGWRDTRLDDSLAADVESRVAAASAQSGARGLGTQRAGTTSLDTAAATGAVSESARASGRTPAQRPLERFDTARDAGLEGKRKLGGNSTEFAGNVTQGTPGPAPSDPSKPDQHHFGLLASTPEIQPPSSNAPAAPAAPASPASLSAASPVPAQPPAVPAGAVAGAPNASPPPTLAANTSGTRSTADSNRYLRLRRGEAEKDLGANLSKNIADGLWEQPSHIRDLDGTQPTRRVTKYFFEAEQRTLQQTVPSNESYIAPPENGFQSVAAEPLSTFSIDVDTASYANVRRMLNQGQRPPPEAVRLEEMINYFPYDYPAPEGNTPFAVKVDTADCPWHPAHRLARIGLRGRDVAGDRRPASNLVFLVDVSGSMNEPNKLPLVKQSLRLLVDRLSPTDRVAMVTYAGNSGLVLESTTGERKDLIAAAIDALQPGGSTHGSAGIQQAYDVAGRHFIKEGVNRVILATDGDFNVGITDREELNRFIVDRAKGGVFLSVLGYGMGNLKDSTMEMLADKGNGNYAYIDSLGEARKVLAEQMNATLVTIAKDVKIQIEFNPAVVRSYRLLGYENRVLAKEDFNDDRKDAGEIGAGHTVTALYEFVPVGAPPESPPIDPLKYQPKPGEPTTPPPAAVDPAVSREAMTVKLRYKEPEGTESRLLEVPVVDAGAAMAEGAADFKFAASLTAFGMLLKNSAHKGTATWDIVRHLALAGKGPDPLGYRGEFIQLIDKARGLAPIP